MGFECPGKRGCHGRHRSGVEVRTSLARVNWRRRQGKAPPRLTPMKILISYGGSFKGPQSPPTTAEEGIQRTRYHGGETRIICIDRLILFLFPPLPSLTWHPMSSFAVHISVCALLAVDLDNSKGGSGFGRFSKGHDGEFSPIFFHFFF